MKNNQQNQVASGEWAGRLGQSKQSHSSSKALTSRTFEEYSLDRENSSRGKVCPLTPQQHDRENIGDCLTDREWGRGGQIKPIRSILQKRKAAKLNQIKPADPSPHKRPQLTLLTSLCDTDRKMRETNSTQCHSPRLALPLQPSRIMEYRIIRLLGQGKFGEVFLAKHIKTGLLGALKMLRKSQVLNLPPTDRDKIVAQISQEIKIQSYLSHPNLIQLYDFFSDQSNLYLFMELASDGQLFELLEQRGCLSEEATSIVVREIAKGIEYMHSKMVIHRDIKLENIVLTHGMAKICDFGWSVFEPREFRQTICGTPLYLSPEVLRGKKYNDKIDIWALGTLAHELYTKETPFLINRHQDLEKIITADFQMKEGSPQLRSFVNFILRKNPSKRPDADILLSHPFIIKYRELQTSDELYEMN